MRIALTITELYPGGAEKCFVNLTQFLKDRGHAVSVWQLWPDTPIEHRQFVEQLEANGISVASGGAARAKDFPFTARWLRKELRDFKPDVIQSFLFHANVASAFAAPKSVPLFGGARVSQPEWSRRLLQRWAARRMNKLICVSESVAEHCEKIEKIPREKLHIIPNGIRPWKPDSTGCDWTELGLPSDSKVVLFVGRLTRQKGILELLEHGCPFLKKLPEHRLVIMGDGVLRAEVESAIKDTDHVERIHLVGWNQNPQSWMEQASCLVLPAGYEGMPNVVLEAMAAARPVVSFDVDGVRELLGSEPAGEMQIASAGDLNELNDKLVHLLSDNAGIAECSRHNLDRATNQFDLEHLLKQYEALYVASLA